MNDKENETRMKEHKETCRVCKHANRPEDMCTTGAILYHKWKERRYQ